MVQGSVRGIAIGVGSRVAGACARIAGTLTMSVIEIRIRQPLHLTLRSAERPSQCRPQPPRIAGCCGLRHARLDSTLQMFTRLVSAAEHSAAVSWPVRLESL